MVAAAFRSTFILIDVDFPSVFRQRGGSPLHVDAHALVSTETPSCVVPVGVARIVGDVGEAFIPECGECVALTLCDVGVPNEELRIPYIGVMGSDIPISDEGQA